MTISTVYQRRTTSFFYPMCMCVCALELKHNIYTNPVYANCIPNEFDVIIIMMVQTKCAISTLTNIFRVCVCSNSTYRTGTHIHVQLLQISTFSRACTAIVVLFTFYFLKVMPHSKKSSTLSYIIMSIYIEHKL